MSSVNELIYNWKSLLTPLSQIIQSTINLNQRLGCHVVVSLSNFPFYDI